jgi:hypothetical protein
MIRAEAHYIPDEWLRAVAGKSFVYPCAGDDILEPISIFAPHMADLWFVDICYPRGLRMPPAIQSPSELECSLVKTKIDGAPLAQMERRGDHRFLPPSRLIESYVRKDNTSFRVIRRRGFGQIALQEEFSDRNIGVFFHRGDGGESNVSFFENKPRRYAPLSNLLSLLRRRLAEPALVVSDGSTTSRRHPVAQFFDSPITSAEAFDRIAGRQWIVEGQRWTCVGYVGRRYGPTLVWAVE